MTLLLLLVLLLDDTFTPGNDGLEKLSTDRTSLHPNSHDPNGNRSARFEIETDENWKPIHHFHTPCSTKK